MSSNIEVLESKEVWWATTREYTLEVDGETVRVRIAETPKSTEFFEWNESTGWEESDTEEGIMAEIYEAWSEGTLD